MSANTPVCKKCNKGKLDERVPRDVVVKKLFFWLPLKRFRCSYCNKKTYLF